MFHGHLSFRGVVQDMLAMISMELTPKKCVLSGFVPRQVAEQNKTHLWANYDQWATKKNLALLSIESWLFNRDAYSGLP